MAIRNTPAAQRLRAAAARVDSALAELKRTLPDLEDSMVELWEEINGGIHELVDELEASYGGSD